MRAKPFTQWLWPVLLSVSLLTACQSDDTSTAKAQAAATAAPNPAETAKVIDQSRQLSEILSQRPKSITGRNEPLLLTFRQPIIEAAQLGSSADAYISLNPAVKGKASFDALSSIRFTPDAPLASAQVYTLTLKPKGLLNLPSDLQPIDFAFKTPSLELDVQTKGLAPMPNVANQMQLEGAVYTSDFAPNELVEKSLQAQVQNKTLAVVWDHNPNGTEHRFTVVGIPRETFATDLMVKWDGKALNAQGKTVAGEKVVKVPSQKTFSLTRVQTEQTETDGKPRIAITFSDVLSPSQDLSGLVQFGSDKIRTQIEGNRLLVYPSADLEPGEYKLIIQAGIQASEMALGKLTERFEQTVSLEGAKPQVRFVGRGSLLPDNQTLEIPIETQAVNAVQISAFEIYPENIPQFLQVNALNDSSETQRVGRYLWRKTIPISSANPNQWNRFTLDATQLLKTKPGTLYRLEMAVDRRHSTYKCPAGTPVPSTSDKPLDNYDQNEGGNASGWDGISDYYANASEDGSSYSWEERGNPCHDSYYYYNSEKVTSGHNFMASNLGLMAKQEADGTLHIISTDLRSATPASGVNFEVRNYQGRSLAIGTSDAQGFATLPLTATPFLLVAKQGEDTGYLKLNANTTLATSQFDVGGESLQKGVKGYLYGERGVWRPGDDIFLTFVLQDRLKSLPQAHPVTVQLIDPMGKVKQVITNKAPVGPFYTFKLRTNEHDQTGNWLVKARLGGSTFDKTLKIETVRPNRLKVELNYPTEVLYGYKDLPPATLFSQWLHGGTASNLKADVSVRLREKTTEFKRYTDYSFDDPTRRLDSEDQQLVEGRLDETGKLEFSKNFQPKQAAPGMLSAWFTSRVHEEGGGFSIAKQTMDYHPFQHYVGIKLPKGDAERNMLLTDQDHTVDIATIDAEGNDVALSQIQVTLYKIEWKWWWDKTADSLAEYADASHSSKLQQSIISTTNGRGTWKFQIKYPDWGRYLIRACDMQGQHCTGKTLYVDWPGWAGRAQEDSSGAAAMLRFASDKATYQVGETAQIQLPEADAGRALLTVENSSRILEQRWIEFDGKRAQVPVSITADMAPNAYVSISLLQPHKDKKNDRPIRLYGIIPLTVENPTMTLQPVLNLPDEWKPESTQTFSVSEQSGKAMSYTLAVVDEGLLGLTRFETPDLKKALFRKEALGIKTWDLFDDVIGAYGGQLERLLALGGGDEAQIDDAAAKPKRFPPVVRFLGAFQLAAGETKQHTVDLPSYLGSVRVMLIAAQDTAYGKAEKSVFVRQPLMMLSSLPRTLKINETVNVPLTVFAGTSEVKDVQLSAEVDKAFTGKVAPVSVNFAGPGEKVATIQLKAGAVPAQGKLKFTATSGAFTSSHEVNIDIQAPNLPSSRSTQAVIEPKANWNHTLKPHGLAGSNQSVLEVSALPGMNLERHMDYLVQYPHGCLEQTTSAAFPQLFLSPLLKLDENRQKAVEKHIKAAILKLNDYQAASGNLMYWPGSNEAHDWASIYAGHFLVEAQKLGYNVPMGLLTGWLNYQINQAQQWTAGSSGDTSAVQAYRLYVLAAAGKPQMGAMNRLRESGKANEQARWLLAAAYRQTGQQEAAQQITAGLAPTTTLNPTPDLNFNHRLGQLGLQLETLLTLGKLQDAESLVQQIAQELGSDKAANFNTHDLAWALMSVSHYLKAQNQPIQAQLTVNQGSPLALNAAQSLLSQLLPPSDTALAINVRNDTAHKLYATVTTRGIAVMGNEQAENLGLELQASLKDKTDQTLWDTQTATGAPLALKQGDDYTLTVNVKNTSGYDLRHIALSTLLPSGVEIVQSDTPQSKSEAKPNANEGADTEATSTTTEASSEESEGENAAEGESENAASTETSTATTETATENTSETANTNVTNDLSKPAQKAGLSYQDVRDDRVLSYFDLKKDATQSVTIKVNAAFLGEFYFPAISAEAMYEPSKRARSMGMPLSIVKTLATPTPAPAPATPEIELTN
ncbi:alpha-2-macroglobulin family protein [Thiolinea disciformis]|uniref:alpha-2-macroglobulin family protein n=1 Tax=Thiolinea disciformis TaxID=125614 RepID=UPI00037A5476|nr:MG2 domain-containing protein [Thiolinea disciformis]